MTAYFSPFEKDAAAIMRLFRASVRRQLKASDALEFQLHRETIAKDFYDGLRREEQIVPFVSLPEDDREPALSTDELYRKAVRKNEVDAERSLQQGAKILETLERILSVVSGSPRVA